MNLFDKTIEKKVCPFCNKWIKFTYSIYWVCSNDNCPVKLKLNLAKLSNSQFNIHLSVQSIELHIPNFFPNIINISNRNQIVELKTIQNIFNEPIPILYLPDSSLDSYFLSNYHKIINNIINFS